MGATLALIGHYKVKPFFLAMPEYLYSDQDGSKYGVTITSYFKVVAFALVIPFLFSLSILLMSPDYSEYVNMVLLKRLLKAGCEMSDLNPVDALHLLHF